MTPKQNTLQVLAALPENISYKELQEELRILAALAEAEDDIREGRVTSHEEVKSRFVQWTSN